MGMKVDETRGHDQAIGVDDPRCLVVLKASDLRHATIFNCEVVTEPRQTCSVDDHSTANNRVKFSHFTLPPGEGCSPWCFGRPSRSRSLFHYSAKAETCSNFPL